MKSNDDTNIQTRSQALSTFSETFGLPRPAAIGVVIFATAIMAFAVFWFVHAAPPRTLTMTSGPEGSSFERTAERYRDVLASNGVTLRILPSEGSSDNLKRLANPLVRVDVGFVQAGQSNDGTGVKLNTLGSVAYQPLLIFYRSATPVNFLSDLAGRRLAIGPPGSGTRLLAAMLLETNGILAGGPTALVDFDAPEAAKALLDGKVDAVFLMGDSASSATMRSLLRAPGIQMFDFLQADAYTRKFSYLNKLQIPRGAIDLAKDVPSHDVSLIGPTVELVARSSLHPALSELLLEAARVVHGNATLLQRRGEFPAPLEHNLPLSSDAARYYKSGQSFLYRSLPFSVASLVSPILVALAPMILVLVPGLRLIPFAYKWRTQLRIYRWYRNLLRVERDAKGDIAGGRRDELRRRLDDIEKSVNQMKVPASFAGQFYVLREHIGFVRGRLIAGFEK